jgi:hypothetical protein
MIDMENEFGFGFGGSIMVAYVERKIEYIIRKSRDAEWYNEIKDGLNCGSLKGLVWREIYMDDSTMAVATDTEWREYVDMVFEGIEEVEPFVIDRDRKLAELIG